MAVKIVLAGHSHVHALGVPGRVNKQPPALVPIKHPTADIAGIVGAGDGAYWDAFVDAAAARVPAVIWTGNQHYAHFLFRPEPALDFVLSAAPHLPVDRAAHVVPEEMLRTFFAKSLTDLTRLLERLGKHSPFPPIVIGTPPPKGDPERLCANIGKEVVLTQVAQRIGVTIEPSSLTDVRVMVKLWRLLQTMLAEIAAREGATFVAVPPRLMTAEYLLLDKHWAADATHANRAYGRVMLEEVVRHAGVQAARVSGSKVA
jgi:hypothetical protein